MDEFEEIVAGSGIGERRIACVLTPVASERALAGLAAMSDVHALVFGSSTGAVASVELTGEVDPFAALTGAPPDEAAQLATRLSTLLHVDMVLVVSTLSEGDSGSMAAWRVSEGEIGETVSPGLVLAGADSDIEDVLVGVAGLDEIKTIDTATLPRWKAARMFARGLKRKRI